MIFKKKKKKLKKPDLSNVKKNDEKIQKSNLFSNLEKKIKEMILKNKDTIDLFKIKKKRYKKNKRENIRRTNILIKEKKRENEILENELNYLFNLKNIIENIKKHITLKNILQKNEFEIKINEEIIDCIKYIVDNFIEINIDEIFNEFLNYILEIDEKLGIDKQELKQIINLKKYEVIFEIFKNIGLNSRKCSEENFNTLLKILKNKNLMQLDKAIDVLYLISQNNEMTTIINLEIFLKILNIDIKNINIKNKLINDFYNNLAQKEKKI